eukprot:3939984-Rhodomonas_salina.1
MSMLYSSRPCEYFVATLILFNFMIAVAQQSRPRSPLIDNHPRSTLQKARLTRVAASAGADSARGGLADRVAVREARLQTCAELTARPALWLQLHDHLHGRARAQHARAPLGGVLGLQLELVPRSLRYPLDARL